MTLEKPDYLWLLLAIPFFLLAAALSYREASALLYRFARVKKRFLPAFLASVFFCLSTAAVVVSLAEPKLQYNKVIFNRSGIDVAIGIDVSKSMLAEDETVPADGQKLFTTPNRLNRARYCALNVINGLRGERAAVFMFASKGVPIVPLTNDYAYCQYILKHVNDTTIAIPGSDLAQAVNTGLSLFEGSPRKTVKAIVLISDGEDISEDSSPMYEAAQRAASQGVAVYTVGVGGGQPVLIPIRDSESSIEGYYLDEDGSYLKTRMEQETLKGISSTTGGRYFSAREPGSDDGIVEAILKRARTIEYTRSVEPAWFSLAPTLLCGALLFFIVGLIVGR